MLMDHSTCSANEVGPGSTPKYVRNQLTPFTRGSRVFHVICMFTRRMEILNFTMPLNEENYSITLYSSYTADRFLVIKARMKMRKNVDTVVKKASEEIQTYTSISSHWTLKT